MSDMPDRAVVVDDDRHFHWSNAVAEMTPKDQADWIASFAGDDDEAVIARMQNMNPRALIALSEDRQWLVVNERWPHGTFFMIYRWDVQPNMVEPWRWVDKEDDTGQDAHQVLADFLRERGA